MKRKQLISYENAEDLTQKVDAFFHRKRSPLSSGAAAEIRDDLTEEDEYQQEGHEDNDAGFFFNLQRRIDDATSTCPSTNPSLSQDELNQWYSSSWSSFTYYGSAHKTNSLPSAHSDSHSNSKHHRPQRSCPLPTTSRREHSCRQQHAAHPSTELPWYSTSAPNGRSHGKTKSSSSMPDFLEGVEFKSTSRHNQKQLPVIELLPSPPNSFSIRNRMHREMVPPMESAVLKENQKEETRFRKRRKTNDSRGRRRFGRKAREFWEKTKGMFRQ